MKTQKRKPRMLSAGHYLLVMGPSGVWVNTYRANSKQAIDREIEVEKGRDIAQHTAFNWQYRHFHVPLGVELAIP